MNLHCPVDAVIFSCQEQHEFSLVLHHLFLGNILTGKSLGNDGVDGFLRCRMVQNEIQTVVGNGTAVLSKESHTVLDCFL